MRVLFLTNFYPPYEIGGQEHSCKQVVEGLRSRGHETLVLTSMHGTGNAPVEADGICRWLYLEMDLTPLKNSITFFTERKARERTNLQRLQSLLERFDPHVVFIWGMWNVPRSVPLMAENSPPAQVLYRFAEYWPTLPSQYEMYWRSPGNGFAGRALKAVLGRVALGMLAGEPQRQTLKFENAYCVSEATRDVLVEKGIPVAHAPIIHTGLDAGPYLTGRETDRGTAGGALRLLYAGRLTANKGIATAIRALGRLSKADPSAGITLTIAGSGSSAYIDELKALARELGVYDRLHFAGLIPQPEMPAFLQKYDVLLVPSVWQEPFARAVLEGMAAGMVVIASRIGGAREIIIDGENGFLFSPGNDEELARLIAGLTADPSARSRLAAAGRETVLQEFGADAMIDAIEEMLADVTRRQQVLPVDQSI